MGTLVDDGFRMVGYATQIITQCEPSMRELVKLFREKQTAYNAAVAANASQTVLDKIALQAYSDLEGCIDRPLIAQSQINQLLINATALINS